MHLNSGAIYRAIAFRAAEAEVALDDEAALVKLAGGNRFSFELGADGKTRFLLDGADRMAELTRDEVSRNSSRVAVHPGVREFANEVQRTAAKQHSVVVEGRDIGTIVFPEAEFKFFLTASAKTRALRRYRQLRQWGPDHSVDQSDERALEKLTAEIEERDRRDETRACAPTVKAEDATLLDTSELTADEVVERILQRVNNQPPH